MKLDNSPDNFLLFPDNNVGHPRDIDWGVLSRVDEDVTGTLEARQKHRGAVRWSSGYGAGS